MPDIIQLLPDHLANQIAAGEVIQRPASAVKELLENAIDAGATQIQLILKDAGKELIQVVDNGKGMSPMDARMSFERHATSKIRQIDDLFSIRTMGFRGEALASIAAVAQVDMKTRTADDELGIQLVIEASTVLKQEPVSCPEGTSLSIKNLFYNVPARRKFLKSNTAEYKHIIDEFTRVAMAYPEVAFRLYHNNTEQFHLPATHIKGRIVDLLGNKVEQQLVPVDEPTDLLHIHGFVGKPAAATRTRGNQYFFINYRFIRNAYLNHAITTAYEGLLDKEAFPFYVLFFDLDPSRVDINVHPSKQEVKFDDDRMLYAYLHAAVKHALAKFNIAPALDFTLNPEIQQLPSVQLPASASSNERAGAGYLQHSFSKGGSAHLLETRKDREAWEMQKAAFFPSMPSSQPTLPQQEQVNMEFAEERTQQVLQWREFLITTLKSGLLVLHQKRALERILYEQLTRRLHQEQEVSQQLLFPVSMELTPADATLLEELLPFLKRLGFDMQPFGKNTYALQGVPPDVPPGSEQHLLEDLLEQMKHEASALKLSYQERLLRSMSKRLAHPSYMQPEEASALIDELFACQNPQLTPDGTPVFSILPKETLASLLQ